MARAPSYIANFDSSSAMLRATARFLHGKDFPALGLTPAFLLKPYASMVGALPEKARELIYSLSGAREGLSPGKLHQVRAEELSEWVVREYPQRRYPAVMIGSASGALVHLGAALGIPWIPQTFLIPVRRTGIHPDDMQAEMDWGRAHAGELLANNPELQLHQMADPNQDRLMIRYMTYFRVKRRRLGPALERFIARSVAPGGTIIITDCTRTWPTVRIGERHYFQPGATGGLSPEEYITGSARVAELLERYESPRRRWDPPPPDGESPEAEWGFEPALAEDARRVAEERGLRIRRLTFADPQDLSPLVADFYRWWYERRGIPSNRLLAESFIVLEPWWTLRTGSVPFWMTFNVEASAAALERYLESRDAFEELNLMLFSHGTESAGLAPIERWRRILESAPGKGQFLGTDPKKYPKDFAVFGRYHSALRSIPGRHPIPDPLGLEEFEGFLRERSEDRGPRWLED